MGIINKCKLIKYIYWTLTGLETVIGNVWFKSWMNDGYDYDV